MTKWAVHKLYTLRTHPVHTAAVFVTCLAAPASAQEMDTLVEFQARCLTPMIEIYETDVSALTRIPHRSTWELWVLDGVAWHLRRAMPDAAVQYCSIHGAFGEEVDLWAEGAIASGDFIRIDREPETLQSTFLREPLIEIEIDRRVPSLTVIETNLES